LAITRYTNLRFTYLLTYCVKWPGFWLTGPVFRLDLHVTKQQSSDIRYP